MDERDCIVRMIDRSRSAKVARVFARLAQRGETVLARATGRTRQV